MAGTGLTFGMWWIYFAIPAADLLHAHRERSFASATCTSRCTPRSTGAGLHTAAYYVERHSELGWVGTVLTVAIPVGVYVALVYVLYGVLVRSWDAFHVVLTAHGRGPGRGRLSCRRGGVDGDLSAGRDVRAGGHRRRVRGGGVPACRRGDRRGLGGDMTLD